MGDEENRKKYGKEEPYTVREQEKEQPGFIILMESPGVDIRQVIPSTHT